MIPKEAIEAMDLQDAINLLHLKEGQRLIIEIKLPDWVWNVSLEEYGIQQAQSYSRILKTAILQLWTSLNNNA